MKITNTKPSFFILLV